MELDMDSIINDTDAQKKQKCLTIALIGEPNAGKSTLINQIIGQKISIVTHKVQTTRSAVRGIKIIDDTQFVS